MKITDIKIRENDNLNVINSLLKYGKNIPYVFDNIFFEIYYTGLENTKFIYRRLYEDSYLNRTRENISTTEYLLISLSEVHIFLRKATPPILSKQLKESSTNVYDIIECLKLFLIEESVSLPQYHSIFLEECNLNSFDNSWEYITMLDNSPIKRKLSFMINNINDDFIIINGSQASIVTITKNEFDRNNMIVYTLMFKYGFENQVCSKILKELDSMNPGFIAVGEFSDFKGIMLSMSLNENNKIPNIISAIINKSYKKFINNEK